MEHQGTAVLGKGTRLGEYEIERLIGVGSMGAVYEAICTPTAQRFAIKILNPALAAMPTARARFLKEAKLTALVRHPHIIDVSDVGEDAGRIYLVMELLGGEDLAHRLHRGPLSTAETVDILLPVCDAVAEAHRRGVTHRDLKPSNIFLLVRGRRPHPVVLDFGIAKDDDGTTVENDLGAIVARQAIFGTPFYLAPEQVADHRAAGPTSDQYALGVILYECLTGHPPFRGETAKEVFRAIVAGNPMPPSMQRPDVPPDMDAIVLRALALDPKARFESVAELRSALLPFSSKATGATPAPYRRVPSSPAIAVEAATPTPFVRTLTPEVQAISGAWSAPVETSDVIAGETVPLPSASDAAPDAEPAPSMEIDVDLAAAGIGTWALASKRVWIGAVAGVAVASLTLVLVVKRVRSGHAPASSTPAAEVLVQIEPAAAKPAADNVAVAAPAAAPSPSPSPSMEAKPVPAAEPAAVPAEAPVANEAPAAVAKEAPAAAAEPVAVPKEAPAAVAKEAPPSAPKEAPPAAVPAAGEAAEVAAEPAPAPKKARRVAAEPEAAPSGPAALAPRDAPAAADPARARKPASKPRTPSVDGVRMHNGVPLLD